jgi:UDP-glucuronate decarboxylase
MLTIGIIGNGFVGRATQLFGCDNIKTLVYDIKPELCIPLGITLSDLDKNSDLIFICVPTPLNHNGNCYTKLVEDILKQLNNQYIIVRSTVPVGFSENNSCYFMPEFLTEANWEIDFKTAKYWVFGLTQCNTDHNIEFKKRITYLLDNAQMAKCIENTEVYFLTNTEAEFLKLAKNCYLASKVSIMNELYTLSSKLNIDYNNIRSILKLDKRIGHTHLDVPGYKGLYGFGGTCFPKDTHSLYSQFQNNKLSSHIFQSVLFRNDFIDRPQREWTQDKWRTTLPTDKPISLVTGGAGFLGSNLCGMLLKLDHIVICLDNFSTGFKSNINEYLDNPNFLLKVADVQDKIFLPKVDYIWHLACPASPPKYQNSPYNTLLTSILGTKNIIELAKQHDSYLVFTSTSEVYGDPHITPQPESYWGNVNTVGVRSCYDEGKRCAETMIYTQGNPKFKIARLFNTYGPKMDIDDGRVITNFLKNILEDTPVPIYGDGLQTRSFCYVTDTLNCLVKLMFSNIQGPVNIGNPDCHFSIKELVDVFSVALDKKLETVYLPLPSDDPKQRMPDITLAKEKLNWKPSVKLEDGIKLLVQYYLKK